MTIKEENITFGILENDDNFRSILYGLLKMNTKVGKIIEFSSAEEALRSETLSTIEFLIVDYRLSGMDGIQFLGQPSILSLNIPKVILSGFNAEEKIFTALQNGATGYLFKEEIQSLYSVLDIMISGGAYITPTLAIRVAAYFKKEAGNEDKSCFLTNRENQVLFEIGNGQSPKEISLQLSISLNTVRSHIRNIYEKLQVSNQIQLMQKAQEIHFSNYI